MKQSSRSQRQCNQLAKFRASVATADSTNGFRDMCRSRTATVNAHSHIMYWDRSSFCNHSHWCSTLYYHNHCCCHWSPIVKYDIQEAWNGYTSVSAFTPNHRSQNWKSLPYVKNFGEREAMIITTCNWTVNSQLRTNSTIATTTPSPTLQLSLTRLWWGLIKLLNVL